MVKASATLKTLLFSSTFSDVHFHCPDGAILHAHKSILSTASPYFATVFLGPWDDDHPDGVWKTTNCAEIMKGLLRSMYTGIDNVQDFLAHHWMFYLWLMSMS